MEKMEDYLVKETNEFKFEPYSEDFWTEVQANINNQTPLLGNVVAMSPRGLYVDYKGIRALMPMSFVSTKRIESFEEYLANQITYVIVDCKPKKKLITVSHRVLEEKEKREKLNALRDSIKVGQTYSATIEKITDYGAFMKLENGIQGLCHISQISHEKIKTVDSVLTKGENVKVKVIKNVDGKISLSMKALKEAPIKSNAYTDENDEQIDLSKINLPTGEASTSLSDLLKNLKI